MTIEGPWTIQSQMHPIYMLLVLPSSNSSPFCSTTNRFSATGHFETSAQNDPDAIRVKYTQYRTCPCRSVVHNRPLHQQTHHIKFTPNAWLSIKRFIKKHYSSCLPYIYIRILGTGRQALLLKLIDAHPSPSTHALHIYQDIYGICVF